MIPDDQFCTPTTKSPAHAPNASWTSQLQIQKSSKSKRKLEEKQAWQPIPDDPTTYLQARRRVPPIDVTVGTLHLACEASHKERPATTLADTQVPPRPGQETNHSRAAHSQHASPTFQEPAVDVTVGPREAVTESRPEREREKQVGGEESTCRRVIRPPPTDVAVGDPITQNPLSLLGR